MSTNKQALREQFEVWAEEAGALPWGHLKKQRTTSGNYSVQIYTYMWKSWSACHEALLDELEAAERRTITVKLPADYHLDDGSLNADMMNTCAVVGAFRDALAAAGITVKGE
ncbi:hypothetical protein [Enterobacter hormaechei]|uniref:hypothetical protein n=1 Tax=Enterobacter hormaechei TaxID=158836 RepID=UPI0039C33A39